MDVIEHLRNPLDVLKGLKSALNTHDRLIITGPNVAYWAVRKDLLLGRWNYVDAGDPGPKPLAFLYRLNMAIPHSRSGLRNSGVRAG